MKEKKTTKPKVKAKKREKPLTKIRTASIIRTGASGDNFTMELVRRADEGVKAERVGRPLSYTPEKLWDKFIEYVEFKTGNPGTEERPFASGFIAMVSKDRPLRKNEFAIFAGLIPETLREYGNREEFTAITARINDVIFNQKFDGAARGIFDTNIIARDLGIGDKLDMGFQEGQKIKVVFGSANANADKTNK